MMSTPPGDFDPVTYIAKDVETNRDILMAKDPDRSGTLRVALHIGRGLRFLAVPRADEIEYCTHFTLESEGVVYWFDIPPGAPRRLERHPSGRFVPVSEATTA